MGVSFGVADAERRSGCSCTSLQEASITGLDLPLIQVCKLDKLLTFTGVLERGKRDHTCALAVAAAGCDTLSGTLSDVAGGLGNLCINSTVLVVPCSTSV